MSVNSVPDGQYSFLPNRLLKQVTSDLLNSKNLIVAMSQLWIFVYLGFYVAFNTVQVISQRVIGRAEETSTYSSLGLCTVNC